MTKVTLNSVGDLTQATNARAVINSNSDVIESAFDNTLSRNGLAPNAMGADLDMNSNRILNLPDPLAGTEPVTLATLNALTVTDGNVPAGGSTGQILTKNSNASYDTEWSDQSSSLVAGSNITITGTTPATIAVQTSPTFTTPNIGVATATSINKVTITAPAANATLTIPNGVTLTGPASSGTAMTLGNNETVTGVKTFGSAGAVGKLAVAGTTSGSTIVNATAVASGTLTLPAATDTLVGKATTDVLTNKTYDTAGTGNSFSINGLAATANTGTGSVVRATTPTLVTPVLGVATATSINGASIDNTAWTSYTPTVTSGTGTPTTLTATGWSKAIGKTIHWQASVVVTTVGTAATSMIVSLPFAALHNTVLLGMNATSGLTMTGFCVATNNACTFTKYDNTNPWAAQTFYFSGVYEST